MALADSAVLSAGLFGGGGCFSSFTVVSVVAFADSVVALAGVSALGRCRNCSINFFLDGLWFNNLLKQLVRLLSIYELVLNFLISASN